MIFYFSAGLIAENTKCKTSVKAMKKIGGVQLNNGFEVCSNLVHLYTYGCIHSSSSSMMNFPARVQFSWLQGFVLA